RYRYHQGVACCTHFHARQVHEREDDESHPDLSRVLADTSAGTEPDRLFVEVCGVGTIAVSTQLSAPHPTGIVISSRQLPAYPRLMRDGFSLLRSQLAS